ncbi:FecR family protein [Pedobacter psychrotolerans]|uniref:Anti-sigma factor n=1 Tax=Pedobacter psychrotolerans TaxID=1843235 RepID=A0A4R2HJ83_9SPHI|nr:FecR domain-containing protein [Pedobacter psychrotolerans]TCO28836.1 FecR family protein [Pedobacter psychrotolerans]GGE52136.1 anti-sigma factor [Pedobacter psychrotolerans]
MPNNLYTFYTTENFLDDADFLRYVKYNRPVDVSFWNNWLSSSPENIKSFQEARLQLQILLSYPPVTVSDDFKMLLLQDINLSIDRHQNKRRKKVVRLFWGSGIAASLLVAAFALWFYQSTVVVRSDYAENQLVHLPDGSDVQLNANSTLTYRRAINWLSQRAVKLEGEAYFKVKHINVNQKQIKRGELFIVITKNARVQVLGTEFNVKERHNQTNITLVTGKIQVSATQSSKQYILKPGTFIEFGPNGRLSASAQTLNSSTAWLSGKIVVNQTSVNEILREFEDLYGYTVILDSPALGNKKIDGTISIKSEESLLFTLKNILNVEIKKEGKTIYLKNR